MPLQWGGEDFLAYRPSFFFYKNDRNEQGSRAHIGLASSFGAVLVNGCGARAVSRKIPIYFMSFLH